MTKIKKVLFVCSIYKPNIGGVETIIEELCDHYNKINIKTAVLTKRFPHGLTTKEKYKKTDVFRFDRPIKLADYIKVSKWLKSIDKEIKSDIVHLVGVRRPMPLFALLLARKWKVPFLANFVGGDLPDKKDTESIRVWKENNGTVVEPILQADRLLSFSKSINKTAFKTIKKLGNIRVVYAGLDLKRINKAKKMLLGYPYFVCVRRLVKDKGVDILIKAFDNVKDRLGNTKLIVIGDGPEKQNLEKLVKVLNLQQKVTFLGQQQLDIVFSYLKGSIAHICPSRAEGGGIINFEAQAAKCLAIGSNAGGIPEYIIDRKTGLLFKSESVEDLSKKLLKSIDACYRRKIIKNAYKNIKKYSWKNISKLYISEYRASLRKNTKKIVLWSQISDKMWHYIN